jgi:CRISPR/Cas system-associated exonuclease Cas4 (RecB family)
MFYAIYFFQRYENINTIKISYVYVEHEDMENSIVLERKYLENYVKELFDMIHAAENDKIFVKNESHLCNWCDFKEHCSTEQ